MRAWTCGAIGWAETALLTANAQPSSHIFFIVMPKDLAAVGGRAMRQGLAVQPTCREGDAMQHPPSDLEEVMRFDPDEGISDLDDHLDRLRTAAEAQGFKFDRHAARNELQAATFGKRRPATARMLLSPTGAMAIEVKPLD